MPEDTPMPSLNANLVVRLPFDVHFAAASEISDLIEPDFYGVSVTRPNPNAPVGGAPWDFGSAEAIYLTIEVALGVGAAAFLKRFGELLADDAHDGLRRALASLTRRIAQHRSKRAPPFIYVEVQAENGSVKGLKWQASNEAETKRLLAAVSRIPRAMLARHAYFLWHTEAGEWRPYEPRVPVVYSEELTDSGRIIVTDRRAEFGLEDMATEPFGMAASRKRKSGRRR